MTVNDICEGAEIAPRTFFRYFAAKEDVLAEPVREMADRAAGYVAMAPAELDDAACLNLAMQQLGEFVVANQERLSHFYRVVKQASAVRTHPLLRLSDRESELVAQLVQRREGSLPGDWRTRLLVARTTASLRIWLDDLISGSLADPLEHLDEVLAAG